MSEPIDIPLEDEWESQGDDQYDGALPAPAPALRELLRAPAHPSELDIPLNLVIDILLRMMFNEGEVALRRFGEVTRLELKLLDHILIRLQEEHIVEVVSAGGVGRLGYTYSLSDAGSKRARDALARSQYVGPAPVNVERYAEMILLQTQRTMRIVPQQVRKTLAHLVLPDDFHRRIGPALSMGTSMFLYGPPGNGKTDIAQSIARLIAGTEPIWVPYALTIGGHIVSIHDPLIFREVPLSKDNLRAFKADKDSQVDRRCGYFQRPTVIVGGELTMAALDLRFDPVAKFYEAPLQLKANGGMFLIDDFGRQMISPAELLNRWVVPLESHVDYLRLQTGQTIAIPFQQLMVFSTNIEPRNLVDDAFLRRIQMKVKVNTPDERAYTQIFALYAQRLGVPLDRDAFFHLIQKWYREPRRTMQAVHPRDILRILVAMADYEGLPPRMTPETLDTACESYFVDSIDNGASLARTGSLPPRLTPQPR
jgi:predicted ATPase with chaperone activity